MRFSSGLISGKLVDRFGERAVLGFGLFMVSFFTLLTGLSQSYGQMLTFRSLGGLGSSMFSVSAGSLLMRSVSDDVRARAQSLYNGGFLLGGITGPAFGKFGLAPVTCVTKLTDMNGPCVSVWDLLSLHPHQR